MYGRYVFRSFPIFFRHFFQVVAYGAGRHFQHYSFQGCICFIGAESTVCVWPGTIPLSTQRANTLLNNARKGMPGKVASSY